MFSTWKSTGNPQNEPKKRKFDTAHSREYTLSTYGDWNEHLETSAIARGNPFARGRSQAAFFIPHMSPASRKASQDK